MEISCKRDSTVVNIPANNNSNTQINREEEVEQMVGELLNNLATNLILEAYDMVFNDGEVKKYGDNPREKRVADSLKGISLRVVTDGED